ncbi:hypothetical protein C0991_002707, partial [Blastosporella zonata]
IGPVGLTVGTLKPNTNGEVPTVSDNAFSQHLIAANQIGVFYKPYSEDDTKGELTWGGANLPNIAGRMTFT